MFSTPDAAGCGQNTRTSGGSPGPPGAKYHTGITRVAPVDSKLESLHLGSNEGRPVTRSIPR